MTEPAAVLPGATEGDTHEASDDRAGAVGAGNARMRDAVGRVVRCVADGFHASSRMLPSLRRHAGGARSRRAPRVRHATACRPLRAAPHNVRARATPYPASRQTT